MAEIFTGVAGTTISSVVIAPLIQLIEDVIHLDQNTQLLQDKLSSTRILLQDMSNQFEHDQRSLPNTVTDRLQKIHQSLEDAKSVIGRSQQQKWCLDCFACKPRVSTQIRAWTTNFDELLNNVRRDFQLFCAAQQIALSATQRPEALLQPVPDSGFVGLGIKDAEKMVQTWLNTEDHQFRVIGIYGLGGIGKTALLKTVYNTNKTGNVFQAVLWITISQTPNILNMQKVIWGPGNLDLHAAWCSQLRELGIGRWGSAVGFPMLERLYLLELPRLESMRSSSSNIVWSKGLMPKLHSLYITGCPSLKGVPKELAKLPNLREIRTYEAAWWEGLIWEDDDVKKTFEDKFRKPVL